MKVYNMLIDRIWRSQPGKYFCVSTKSATGDWKDNFFARDELSEVATFVERNKGKDIYFCPHGFNEKRRKENCAVLPTLLWADLDEIDPNEIKIKPTIAIESSPGRFVGLWSIDKTCQKEINRRLTYYLGADKGGWDVTQVLRVPGTTNYKYQSLPRVRTLWTDGPTYTLREIEKQLPQENKEERDDDALDVYREYEKDLPPWVRRELLNGKPTPGKRSEMIWKLTNTLMECGVSRDDAFILLRASPWNKFKGRDHQLEREIEKASGKKFKGTKKQAKDERRDYRFLSLSMDEVEEEEIDWIWYPYIARGELSILEGDPGVGKSYLAQMISMCIVDGKRLPSVKRAAAPVKGKVAYFDIENSAGSVTKKRLLTNGCENIEDYYQEEEPFSVDDEDALQEVYDAIEKLSPTLVVFDTLNTYIGKADIHKSSETQQAFARFREIAKRYHCAVLVLRHLTKGTRDRALYRGQGSIAFAGLARVVMTVGAMPDEEDVRVMAVTKINVTKPPRALTYTITELPDTLREKDRSKFDWGEFVDITADEIVAPQQAQGNGERDGAKSFLKDLLSDGPVDIKRVERQAEQRSINMRTVQRAADELGVMKKLTGFGEKKSSTWSLPEEHGRKDRGKRR
jgi:DNA repair protein RadA/Sms